MAAKIKQTTTAYLYFLLKSLALTKPILVKMRLKIGIRNTTPLPKSRPITKEMYLVAEITGSKSSLAKLNRNFNAGGIRKK